MEEDDMVMRVGSSLGRRRTDEESKEGRRPEELAYKEVPRASRRLALAAPKSSRAYNRVRAGPQSVYPNELISMYKKVSNAEALLVQGNTVKDQPSSLDKNLNLWPKPSGKKGLI